MSRVKVRLRNVVIVAGLFAVVPLFFQQVYYASAPADWLFQYTEVKALNAAVGTAQELHLVRNPQQELPRLNSDKTLIRDDGKQVYSYRVEGITYEYIEGGETSFDRPIPDDVSPGMYQWVETVYIPVFFWERQIAQVRSNWFKIR